MQKAQTISQIEFDGVLIPNTDVDERVGAVDDHLPPPVVDTMAKGCDGGDKMAVVSDGMPLL